MTTDRPSLEQRRARLEQDVRFRNIHDPRFQTIGISAVAAAARYRGEGRNTAYARVEPADDGRAGSAVT